MPENAAFIFREIESRLICNAREKFHLWSKVVSHRVTDIYLIRYFTWRYVDAIHDA